MKVLKFLIKLMVILALSLILVSLAVTVPLRWAAPPTTAFMLQNQHRAAKKSGKNYKLVYQWVDWKEISPYAAIAVIAAEDQKFATHKGFDLESIQDAVDSHKKGRRLRGASTISQQVAKNLYLWPGKTLYRKGLEAYCTFLLESFLPKQRILEIYLNVAQFGPSVFGVKAAATTYFKKTASQITPEEAALLAAVLPNPVRFHADRPSAYVLERQAWILSQMEQLGGPGYLKRLARL